MASAWMNVLQVREYVSARDSFYLNGALAPAMMLAGFGLSQGQITNNYRVKFYRAGEQYPLAYLEYPTSSFSGTPTSINTNQMRLAAPTSVHAFAGIGEVSVYPVPTTNHKLHIAANKVAGQLNYALLSISGQTLATGTASLNGELMLPASLSVGTYYLRLFNAENSAVYPVAIQ
jgi:hypothetical protein